MTKMELLFNKSIEVKITNLKIIYCCNFLLSIFVLMFSYSTTTKFEVNDILLLWISYFS